MIHAKEAASPSPKASKEQTIPNFTPDNVTGRRLLIAATMLAAPLVVMTYLYVQQLLTTLNLNHHQQQTLTAIRLLAHLNSDLITTHLARKGDNHKKSIHHQVVDEANATATALQQLLVIDPQLDTKLTSCVSLTEPSIHNTTNHCFDYFSHLFHQIATQTRVMNQLEPEQRRNAQHMLAQLPWLQNQSALNFLAIERLQHPMPPPEFDFTLKKTIALQEQLATYLPNQGNEMRSFALPVLQQARNIIEKTQRDTPTALTKELEALRQTTLQLSHQLTEITASKYSELFNYLNNSEQKTRRHLFLLGGIVAFLLITSAVLGYLVVRNVRKTHSYLASQNALLEHRVKERTKEISQAHKNVEKLNESLTQQSMHATLFAHKATAANEAKSLFLASMSHEIRTPLNAVIGGTDILSKTPLDAKQQQMVGIISHSGKTLLELVNDILDFSKIEAGELNLEQIEFDCEKLLKTTIDIFQLKAQEKGIELQLDFSPECQGMWQGDPTRIKQVVINLISNAIKFTSDGSIRCAATKTPDQQLQIEVIDTGIGIEKDKISSLFDAFVQSDNSITRKYGGSGLGLTISKRLVDLMGGGISVTSREELGTNFTIQLPLPHIQAAHPSDSPANNDAQTPLTGHILLVEDVLINQIIATEVLTGMGLKVSCAVNGQQAVDMFKEQSFCLILMDLHMPVLNGLDASKQIRAYEKTHKDLRRTPIIAMTADVLADTQPKIVAAGIDDYVPKPFETQDLYNALHRHLVLEPA